MAVDGGALMGVGGAELDGIEGGGAGSVAFGASGSSESWSELITIFSSWPISLGKRGGPS